jgi:hypothetical protein
MRARTGVHRAAVSAFSASSSSSARTLDVRRLRAQQQHARAAQTHSVMVNFTTLSVEQVRADPTKQSLLKARYLKRRCAYHRNLQHKCPWDCVQRFREQDHLRTTLPTLYRELSAAAAAANDTTDKQNGAQRASSSEAVAFALNGDKRASTGGKGLARVRILANSVSNHEPSNDGGGERNSARQSAEAARNSTDCDDDDDDRDDEAHLRQKEEAGVDDEEDDDDDEHDRMMCQVPWNAPVVHCCQCPHRRASRKRARVEPGQKHARDDDDATTTGLHAAPALVIPHQDRPYVQRAGDVRRALKFARSDVERPHAWSTTPLPDDVDAQALRQVLMMRVVAAANHLLSRCDDVQLLLFATASPMTPDSEGGAVDLRESDVLSVSSMGFTHVLDQLRVQQNLRETPPPPPPDAQHSTKFFLDCMRYMEH